MTPRVTDAGQCKGEAGGVPHRRAAVFETVNRVLLHPTGGIAGLVDELLTACLEHGFDLDWQADRIRVRPIGGNWEELTGISLRRSVFRAILARIATLCNAHAANSVSPFGGQGELSVDAKQAVGVRVAFVNTTAMQKLELTNIIPPGTEAARQQEVADGSR